MTIIAFDTLKCANTLKAAGVSHAQAEAEAVALSEALEVNLKKLVTKEDLLTTKNELRCDIEDVRRDMREMEQRMTISWVPLWRLLSALWLRWLSCFDYFP